MKKLIALIMLFGLATPVFAKPEPDVNQEQDQRQTQRQDQDQHQHQSQRQNASSDQNQSADNYGVSQGVTVETKTPKEKTLYKGSLGLSIPEGSEGPLIATPWGGLGFSKASRMTKLTAYYNALKDSGVSADDERVLEVLQAMRKACGLKDKKEERTDG